MGKRLLSAAFVKTAGPGKYGDRDGLILRVNRSGSKQWLWRGTIRRRRVDLGLGSARYRTLREARELAFEYRRISHSGGDPRQSRDTAPTVELAAEQVVEIQRPTWRGRKSENDWRQTLRRHILPTLGSIPVDHVSASDVLRIIGPLWTRQPETARRVRQRLSLVMRWSMAAGFRSDDPVAIVCDALPKQDRRPEHRKALPRELLGVEELGQRVRRPVERAGRHAQKFS